MPLRRKLVQRLAWPLLLAACFAQIVVPLLRIAVSYRAADLGLSAAQILALSSTFSLLPAFLAVGMGRYNDRHGNGRASAAGSALVLAACAMMALQAGGVFWLAAVSVVLGLGQTLQLTALQGEVGMLRLPRHRTKMVGGLMLWQAVGQVAAPLILSLAVLDGASPAERLPLTAGAFALAGFALSLLLWRNGAVPRRGASCPTAMRRILAAPGMFWAMLAGSLCVAMHDLTLVYMPVIGEERGLSASMVGVLLALFACGQMLARAAYRSLAERTGARRAMFWGVLATALGALGLAFPTGPEVLGAVMAFSGFAVGMAVTSSVSLTMELAPPGSRAASLGMRLALNRAGQFLIPLAAGGAAAALGAGGVFLALAASIGGTGLWGARAMLRRG